jgi:hypothetical protein
MEKSTQRTINIKAYHENVTLEKFRRDEEKFEYKSESSNLSSYLLSYPEFLKYFRNLQEITKHHLVIGINFTYGWMPTICEINFCKINEVLVILNSAKQGQIPGENDLRVLKECINNSLVGVSKLLHFINPTKFAIWDSRVFRYLTHQEPHTYRLENFSSYLYYLEFCDFISKANDFEAIHDSLSKKIGYEMTHFRTIELIMFLNGKKQITLKNYDHIRK